MGLKLLHLNLHGLIRSHDLELGRDADTGGQTLYVLDGIGLVGNRKGPPKLITVGDTVWIPPNEEHWHGASEDSMMEHIAIQEALDGKVANWLEQVSDHDYSLTK